jgi:hypothetical protein
MWLGTQNNAKSAKESKDVLLGEKETRKGTDMLLSKRRNRIFQPTLSFLQQRVFAFTSFFLV